MTCCYLQQSVRCVCREAIFIFLVEGWSSSFHPVPLLLSLPSRPRPAPPRPSPCLPACLPAISPRSGCRRRCGDEMGAWRWLAAPPPSCPSCYFYPMMKSQKKEEENAVLMKERSICSVGFFDRPMSWTRRLSCTQVWVGCVTFWSKEDECRVKSSLVHLEHFHFRSCREHLFLVGAASRTTTLITFSYSVRVYL